jgi:transposase
LKLISDEKGLTQASREYGIKDNVLSHWKQEFLELAPQVFSVPKAKYPQEEQIPELERLVGRMTLQLDMAKSIWALELPTEGKRVMVRSLRKWYGYSISHVQELAELPHGSYYYRSCKADESQLMAVLETISGQHVAYGTRQVRS